MHSEGEKKGSTFVFSMKMKKLDINLESIQLKEQYQYIFQRLPQPLYYMSDDSSLSSSGKEYD